MTEQQKISHSCVDKEEAERAQQQYPSAEHKYEGMAKALLDYLGIDWDQHHQLFADELLLARAAAFLRVAFAGEYDRSPEQRFTGQLLQESGEDPHLFLDPDTELP